MKDVAIQVEGLSKCYRIGERAPYKRLSELLQGALTAPFSSSRNAKSPRAAGRTEFWALRDVSFQIGRGEVVGIIGRNGAGKSTLLKVLSGITEPTEGRAAVRGRVGSLLEVGTGFHPELTGRENVFLNGVILGMSRREIQQKFDAIVDFSGVEQFLDTPVKRYSSGMRVRLGFAIAAHLEPEILIIDEVLTVGDAEFRRKCLAKLDQVAQTGRTVLVVSHNLQTVEALCTRGILMAGGQVVASGPCSEITKRYVSELSATGAPRIGERTDRRGDGSALCTDVWFEDAGENAVSNVASGEPFSVCLQYRLNVPDSQFTFRIGIYDPSGASLIHNSTEYVPSVQQKLPREGVMVCSIPRIPLPAGEYYINTSIHRDGHEGADRVERAAFFTVDTGDFYGSGRVPPPSHSKVLCDYRWDFRPANATPGANDRTDSQRNAA